MRGRIWSIVAIGALFFGGGVFFHHSSSAPQHRVFDRRCRGGCENWSFASAAAAIDGALLRLLPTFPIPSGVVASGVLTDSKGNSITYARSGTAPCVNADNWSLTTLAADHPCVDPTGLRIDQGLSNYVLWSEDLSNAVWVADPGVTVTGGTALAPDGTNSEWTINLIADGGSALRQTISGSVGQNVLSAWVQVEDAGSPPVQFFFGTTNASPLTSAIQIATNTPQRLTFPYFATSTTQVIAIGGNGVGNTAPTPGAIHVWGWQVERKTGNNGGSWATTYKKNTSSATAQSYTYAQTNNPYPNSSAWCVFADSMMGGPTTMFFVIGGPYLQADNAAMWTTGTTLTFIVSDHAGSSREVQATTTVPVDGALHNLGGCIDGAGGMDIWIDGVKQGLTPSGAGSGVITTMPPKIYFGNDGTTTYAMSGSVRNFCLGDAGWCAKLPASSPTGYIKVLAVGDSTTEEANGGTNGIAAPWPQVANAILGSSYAVTNGAIAGTTTAQIKSNYEANYHTPGSFSRCVVMGGVNDLVVLQSVTEAQALANLEGLVAEMVTDGCRPIVMAPLPCGAYASCTGTVYTNFSQLRTDLQSYCANSSNGCTFVDTWAFLGNGGNPVSMLPQYVAPDTLHESALACNVIAQQLLPLFP